MNPLDKLLSTIQNLPPTAKLLGNVSSTDRFCLTTQTYTRNQKENVDENGRLITQSLKAQNFCINVFNEDDYKLIKSLLKDFIKSSNDKFKVRIPKIRFTKEIVPIKEFESYINSVCLARKYHENIVTSFVSNFEKQMVKTLGVHVWIDTSNVKVWPEHCKFKEMWFEHVERPDFTSHYQFGITFHQNTELYKRYKPIIREIVDLRDTEYLRHIEDLRNTEDSINETDDQQKESSNKQEETDIDNNRYIEQFRYELYGMRQIY